MLVFQLDIQKLLDFTFYLSILLFLYSLNMLEIVNQEGRI